MSIRQNLQDHLRHLQRTYLNTPTKRAGSAATVLTLLILGYTLSKPETPMRAPPPEPIVQGEQLRFPAGHPQLALLGSVEVKSADSVTIELPARLVWNEERTQRIYPAFAGRVHALYADVGQTVQAGQLLATLASPEFGAAHLDW
jgi:cobalt-zinc-cadmium efflux system membrane fusion protein